MSEPNDRYAQPGQGNDPQFASLREIFVGAFGAWDADDNPYNDAPINVVQAPGRVNLIGEHTDYNDGLVFPMAIRPRITFAFRERTDGQVHAQSEQFPDDEVVFRIDEDEAGEPKWGNYVRGPVVMLRRGGHTLTGMDAYLVNSLPVGAGLSSSAAMEVGTAVAMLHLSGDDMTPLEIAQLCKRAENEVVGLPCGIMDMTAVACGKAGHAMLIDCRSLEVTHVPLDAEKVAVVICDSKAEHELTGGEYKQRRDSCEKAAKHYGVKALRDLTPETLESGRGDLDEETYRRARHVVTEIARVDRVRRRPAGRRLRGRRPGDVRKPRFDARRLRDQHRRDRLPGGDGQGPGRRVRQPPDRRRLRRLHRHALPAGRGVPRVRGPRQGVQRQVRDRDAPLRDRRDGRGTGRRLTTWKTASSKCSSSRLTRAGTWHTRPACEG